ncbi:hypothetical protein CHS0354_036555 [Potamilus streckersoni]|uniref:Uncharacterized protein n=1 Tax=Potamilus streckersoni TaxID=2493646 RepID=A0AAE0SYG0_9BIVA|nr:hypothetical protein CHS0354_036555 [Potamilus streckersoni]
MTTDKPFFWSRLSETGPRQTYLYFTLLKDRPGDGENYYVWRANNDDIAPEEL